MGLELTRKGTRLLAREGALPHGDSATDLGRAQANILRLGNLILDGRLERPVGERDELQIRIGLLGSGNQPLEVAHPDVELVGLPPHRHEQQEEDAQAQHVPQQVVGLRRGLLLGRLLGGVFGLIHSWVRRRLCAGGCIPLKRDAARRRSIP
jgi:hypothetical protein